MVWQIFRVTEHVFHFAQQLGREAEDPDTYCNSMEDPSPRCVRSFIVTSRSSGGSEVFDQLTDRFERWVFGVF